MSALDRLRGMVEAKPVPEPTDLTPRWSQADKAIVPVILELADRLDQMEHRLNTALGIEPQEAMPIAQLIRLMSETLAGALEAEGNPTHLIRD